MVVLPQGVAGCLKTSPVLVPCLVRTFQGYFQCPLVVGVKRFLLLHVV